MTEFNYSEEDINAIEKQLDLLIGKMLMSDDHDFSILVSYTINSGEIEKGWFKKRTEIVYWISSVTIKREGKEVQFKSGLLCSHHGVEHLMRMKNNSDNLIEKLNKLGYLIVENEQEN